MLFALCDVVVGLILTVLYAVVGSAVVFGYAIAEFARALYHICTGKAPLDVGTIERGGDVHDVIDTV
jgi:hypothetical protein